MAVQLKGQSTWDEKAKAQREATAQALYDATKLRPDDTVRFPKMHGHHRIEGRPISVNADGSLNVNASGKIRSVLLERIEVKMRGPRGGVQWVPLIPKDDG